MNKSDKIRLWQLCKLCKINPQNILSLSRVVSRPLQSIVRNEVTDRVLSFAFKHQISFEEALRHMGLKRTNDEWGYKMILQSYN